MERRQHFRVNKSLISQIFADDTDLFVITGDLSTNGIFLISKKCLPVDTAVTIEIALPDNSVSSLRGIVRRIIDTSTFIQSGMGIELIERDNNYINFLNSLLHETKNSDDGMPIGDSSETGLSSIHADEKGFSTPSAEKRQSPRYIVNDKEIAVMIGSSYEAKAVDISAGGISLKTGERLHHDKEYLIHLRNADRNLTLQSAVKWIALSEYRKVCSQSELIPIYTVGMQFTNSQGNTSHEVMHFLDGVIKIDAVYHDRDPVNLSDLILSEFVESIGTAREIKRDNSSRYGRKKNNAEKRRSALYCGRKERAHFLKDPNKEVVLSVLENPKITVMEIEKFVRSHAITEETIKKIIHNKRWLNHYGIVSGIVNNPKAPPFIAAALAKKLKGTDLKKLSQNKEVSEALRGTARELLAHCE
jgi:hypothetical protein